jgi:hypothetical protein
MRWTDAGHRDGRGAPAPPWGLLAAVWLLVTLACAAGASARATPGERLTADEPQYLLSAISLAEDRDLDIADELAAERWREFNRARPPEQARPLDGGRRLSPHDPLLPLLLAVPVALGGWLGAKLALAAMAGLLAALLLWLAVRRLGADRRVAALVVAVCGCTPPLVVYGTQLYPELPAALATTLGIAALTGRLRARGCALLCGAVLALPWLGTKYAPVAAVLFALAAARLARAGEWRRLCLVAAALGVGAASYVAAHLAIYGGLTPYAVGGHFVGGEMTAVGTAPNYAGRSVRLVGLLTDRSFGLAAWQPLWLLAVPALAALLRRRPAGWPALAAPLAAGWLTATFVALTMHGWWWPGRQIVVVLPAAVLGLAWWVSAGAAAGARARAAIVAVVAAAGAFGLLAYLWLLTEVRAGRHTLIVDFWATGNPLYRAWRHALPDYWTPGPTTWPLHALWLALLALAGWRGSRRPPHRRSEPAAIVVVRAGHGESIYNVDGPA